MLRRLLPAMLIALLASSSVIADEELVESDAWPIVQRCISYPVQTPPADWQYEGTILIDGYAGIHGMQQDWETPHVIVPLGADIEGDYPIPGGQVSPDGRWYAVPYGEIFQEISYNLYWFDHQLQIVDLSGQLDTIRIDLQSDLPRPNAPPWTGAWSYVAIEWLDKERFVYGSWLIDHSGSGELFDTLPALRESVSSLTRYTEGVFLSPDRTLAYLTTYNDWEDEFDAGLYGFPDFDFLMPSERQMQTLTWLRDTSGFVAEYYQDDEPLTLALYNRSGEMIETLFELPLGTTIKQTYYGRGSRFQARRASGRTDVQGSRDSRYFAFTAQGYNVPGTLYVIDFDAHTVYDTCIQTHDQPVWSPYQNQFAFLAQGETDYQILVFDVATWQVYRVGWQLGESTPTTFFWR